MSLRVAVFFLALLLTPGLVFAQYGRARRQRSPGPNNGVPNGATPLVNLRGKLRSIDKKKIFIDAGDDQILTLKRTKKTKFWKGDKEIKPDDFPDEARVSIEASRAMNGDLDAVNVFLGDPPSAESEPRR